MCKCECFPRFGKVEGPCGVERGFAMGRFCARSASKFLKGYVVSDVVWNRSTAKSLIRHR
jgi:hypothetical protein